MNNGVGRSTFRGGIRLNSRGQVAVDPRHNFKGKQYLWKEAHFDVPADITDERVQLVAHRYAQKWGDQLESVEGGSWTVLSMGSPRVDNSLVAQAITDPDRRRYTLWAKVTRTPVTLHVDVPDEDVPLFLAHGYKLND